MDYCKNCGATIGGNEKYCPECGAKVAIKENASNKKTDNKGKFSVAKNVKKGASKLVSWKVKESLDESSLDMNREEFYGKVHKCPNCGNIIQTFEMRCSSCGYEFRTDTSSSFISDFSNRISEIERKNQSGLNGLLGKVGLGEKRRAEELSMLIRTVDVPNTKEAILGFLLMAISNINTGDNSSNNDEYSRIISDAWVAKAEQLIRTAKITLGNDEEFLGLQEIYYKKISRIRFKKMIPRIILACMLLVTVIIMFANTIAGAID